MAKAPGIAVTLSAVMLSAVVFSSVCATRALAETIIVRGADCSRLVQQYNPGGADYVPGVDVRGKPVAPADVGGGYSSGGYNMTLPDTIDIQIGVDLADRLALRDAKKGDTTKNNPATRNNDLQRKVMPFEGKAPLGTLSIKGNEAYWNGERLLPEDQVALAEACGQALKGSQGETLPTRKPNEKPSENRQK
jgi:hypothetical protein